MVVGAGVGRIDVGGTIATASWELWSRRRFAAGEGGEDSEGRLAVGRVETVVEVDVVLEPASRLSRAF